MTTSPVDGIVPPHITHPNDIRRHHLAASLRAKAQQTLDRSAQLEGPNGEVSVAATVLAQQDTGETA